MRLRGIWYEVTPYQKLVIFVLLVFLFAFISTAISGVLINLVYNINILSDPNALSDLTNPNVIKALKLMQIFSTIGTFIVPPLLAGFLFSSNSMQFLALNKKPALSMVFAVFAILFVSMPLVNQLMEWNKEMVLPGVLNNLEQWMKNSEAKAAELTEAFLKMGSVSDLFVNLLMVGLIPAISEELVFRGVIQRLFKELVKYPFLAILFTSILFSAMHLQFYGFLPRMMLGILLGYLLEWSGSLWLPILLHFLNNGAAVLAVYFFPDVNTDTIGTQPDEMWQQFSSLALTSILVYLIYHISSIKSTGKEKFST